MNASHWYLNILCRQHGEKVMNFSIYCSLYHVSILFFELKNRFIPFTLVYTPSNIFRAYITLVVKLEHDLWIARLGDYHVWMLTNPIKSKPKHNSGGGVGIWTDSKAPLSLWICRNLEYVSVSFMFFWQSSENVCMNLATGPLLTGFWHEGLSSQTLRI